MSSTIDDNDSGDLRDEVLARALLHAPDHTAAPNWRLRKAILDHAREAVAPFAEAEAPAQQRPWWQRLLGLRGSPEGGARMPWNAAFATVLVGVLVAVLWQREPVPGARPDSEAQISGSPRRSDAPVASVPPVSPPVAAAPPTAAAPATSPAIAPAPAFLPPKSERALLSSEDIPGGPLPAPEPPPEPAAPAATAKGAQPPRSVQGPAPSPTPSPVPSELARRRAGEAALSDAAGASTRESSRKEAIPSGAPATPAPAAAPPATMKSPEPPSFSALSRWSRLTVTRRGGASRSLSRSEAQDLPALLGSAAISAVAAQPMAGGAEWRVTLERDNGDVLATFEVGRNQVGWREGRGAVSTGAPSPASLAALREALQHAVEPPAAPASSPPGFRLKLAPQQPAEPELAPGR